ncbi:N-acetyltransferase family protein [Ornithinimicrobium sp. Y1847]|uniref:GNAT family N-acetyltransferase n=1 Tax=unclassified Ornithinimicrobium TaxID=2615080 RepID=UPI003B676059
MSSHPSDLQWRRLSADSVPDWTALLNHLAVADGTEEFVNEPDLLESLSAPHHDPELDTWGVWDGAQMVAWGATIVPLAPDHEGQARGYVNAGVHADHRGRGIGTEITSRLEARAQELMAQRLPDTAGYLSAGGGLDGSDSRKFLTERGYAVVRYFNLLARPLSKEQVIEVPEIQGVELVTPGPEHEMDVHAAHVAAFRDHWGSGPTSPENWHQNWHASSARPATSTLAIARGGEHDGQVLAYVLTGQWVDRESYINLVGTVPHARGRGLAAAALARTIELATQAGEYDVIELDVDSESPTGATRLYERLGFTLKHRSAAMRRPLP